MKKEEKNAVKDVIGMLNKLIDEPQVEESNDAPLDAPDQPGQPADQPLSEQEISILEEVRKDADNVIFAKVTLFCENSIGAMGISGSMFKQMLDALSEKYGK